MFRDKCLKWKQGLAAKQAIPEGEHRHGFRRKEQHILLNHHGDGPAHGQAGEITRR